VQLGRWCLEIAASAERLGKKGVLREPCSVRGAALAVEIRKALQGDSGRFKKLAREDVRETRAKQSEERT